MFTGITYTEIFFFVPIDSFIMSRSNLYGSLYRSSFSCSGCSLLVLNIMEREIGGASPETTSSQGHPHKWPAMRRSISFVATTQGQRSVAGPAYMTLQMPMDQLLLHTLILMQLNWPAIIKSAQQDMQLKAKLLIFKWLEERHRLIFLGSCLTNTNTMECRRTYILLIIIKAW